MDTFKIHTDQGYAAGGFLTAGKIHIHRRPCDLVGPGEGENSPCAFPLRFTDRSFWVLEVMFLVGNQIAGMPNRTLGPVREFCGWKGKEHETHIRHACEFGAWLGMPARSSRSSAPVAFSGRGTARLNARKCAVGGGRDLHRPRYLPNDSNGGQRFQLRPDQCCRGSVRRERDDQQDSHS